MVKGRKSNVRTRATSVRYEERKNQLMERGVFEDFFYDLKKEKILQEFKYWVIIQNEFPHDLIAETHHLLVLRRVVGDVSEATQEELNELREIKNSFDGKYQYFTETLDPYNNIKKHLHFHLICFKENICEDGN